MATARPIPVLLPVTHATSSEKAIRPLPPCKGSSTSDAPDNILVPGEENNAGTWEVHGSTGWFLCPSRPLCFGGMYAWRKAAGRFAVDKKAGTDGVRVARTGYRWSFLGNADNPAGSIP